MAILTVVAIKTILAIVTVLAIETDMAIVTVLAIKTVIAIEIILIVVTVSRSFRNRIGYRCKVASLASVGCCDGG